MIIKKFGNIMNNLGDIRLFVEAANLGGLSIAGRKLGLSPLPRARADWQFVLNGKVESYTVPLADARCSIF